MISVCLVGGLGNQMFQYAFGRALMVDHEVQFMNHCGQYGMSVDKFNTQVKITSTPQGPGRSSGNDLHYNPADLVVQDPSVLYGYWQCEKYFLSLRPDLEREFILRSVSPVAGAAAEIIKSTPNSVAVHVRRGDYLTWAAAVHGALPLDYYLRAAGHLNQQEGDLKFFIFSDDPLWLTRGFQFPYWSMGVHSTPCEDVWLMSLCKHAIIANSSFSWWGAWLGPDKTGRVIAPQQWFLQGNENSKDIVPERWVRM